jgi:hypothetical protein
MRAGIEREKYLIPFARTGGGMWASCSFQSQFLPFSQLDGIEAYSAFPGIYSLQRKVLSAIIQKSVLFIFQPQ